MKSPKNAIEDGDKADEAGLIRDKFGKLVIPSADWRKFLTEQVKPSAKPNTK
jgi:hypothetical protein